MGAIREFTLPDLGEGLTESELVSWRVAVGDAVQLNQIIAEVETAKALVELPAPWAGVVSRLYVEPGATVQVGEPIIAFEVDASAEATAQAEAVPAPGVPVLDVPPPNLVGYGARVESSSKPARRSRPGLAEVTGRQFTSAASTTIVADRDAARVERPRATPPVRRLASELGVDLASVSGSGERGMVTRHDVEDFHTGGTSGVVARDADRELSRRARETRTPIRGVRKLTAEAMVASAFTAPQATVFLAVDVTGTSELLDRLRADRAFDGVRLTFLAVVAKAVCIAAARTPSMNARWDAESGEIVEFGYVNLGVAAATARGLVVPTIPDADQLTLVELASALAELVAVAREGRTPPQRLTGGTISVSNVGVFGVDAGTPILNPGEAAILALGAVRRHPWEHDGGIALRDVVTLSVSFDHRVADGEQASRFISDVGRILTDPAAVLTMV